MDVSAKSGKPGFPIGQNRDFPLNVDTAFVVKGHGKTSNLHIAVVHFFINHSIPSQRVTEKKHNEKENWGY